MATSDIKISYELRLCKVDDELGYFHRWEDYAMPLEPSPMIGGTPGGQFSRIYGIVEFAGRVMRVEPTKIIFCDESNAFLNAMQKKYSEDLKRGYDPFRVEASHEKNN